VAGISFPPQLPITGRVDEIAAALRGHQVVVVAGATGSGKTTQLPKICLSIGRGRQRRIAHTQPRRLAARTVADRIAEELGQAPGELVGSRVRFSDRTSAQTRVVLMTDGLLLAEIGRDPLLRRYDTVIVDEAHERSLTIDFLLGYLLSILPRRRDLAVVITSATIDPQRFADHVAEVLGAPVPVIEVSGRTYPVQVRYRPLESDQVQGVLDAVGELAAEPPGDVLVFLSGEREIRDTADALREHVGPGTEILPLYARLSTAEQHRVFAPHPGRRVVLATNVAETSLTVPGIRYVVDAGTARISRYSRRTKVQRLPIEPVSQASADQRAGRCGRVADGVAIRLYSEEDYLARPRFTEPEILRTNLAAVILQMAALGLGDLETFPFLDPPDRRSLRDGVALLEELSALRDGSLTPLGRRLARLPVDPRLGRMVLEAQRLGCVQEVLVITAALSIQDPRERPLDAQAAADTAHRRFADPTSDLLTYLNLWAYLQEQQRALSGSAFRRLCRAEYLHFLRVREWQDLVTQLRHACRDLGIEVPARPDLRAEGGTRAAPDRIHQAVLAGLLSQLGRWDDERGEYRSARGGRFALSPGSALARKPPRWVMAAELVETTRVWARGTARIDPSWVEPLAEHLVQRSYAEPRWDARRGAVVATETVTLYGLPVVVGRTVPYARVDPELARELVLRHALVHGEVDDAWAARHPFLAANRATLRQLAAAEERGRRRDLALDDDGVLALYASQVPSSVLSLRHFDTWWRRAGRPDHLLTFSREQLTRPGSATVDADALPDVWVQDDLVLDLHYRFEPGDPLDGVTVDVPLTLLNRLDRGRLSWHVRGLRADLVAALIRSMPKALRRSFVPAPDYAAAVLDRLAGEPQGSLLDAVAGALTSFGGPVVAPSDLDVSALPAFLRLHVRVLDDAGRVLAQGDDVAALQARLARRSRSAVAAVSGDVERVGLTSWTVGTIPRTVGVGGPSGAVEGYPALVDEGGAVALRVLGTAVEQRRAMPRGVRRLLLLDLPSPVRAALRGLDGRARLALAHQPYPSVEALVEDCAAAVVDAAIQQHGGPPWDEDAYLQLRASLSASLPTGTAETVRVVADVLVRAHEVAVRVADLPLGSELRDDVEVQLAGLVYRGFVARTGRARLAHLVRYLTAMVRRLDSAPSDPGRDAVRMRQVHEVEDAFHQVVDGLPPARRLDDDVLAVHWLIEELRVSVFAQQLGTAVPVSAQRVRAALAVVRP
jgi:ATP-dependent helicase HrpA